MDSFIELSALWNPYPSSAGPLWDQSSNTEACLHSVPQRETEREKGEDGVRRKEQDTLMERAERKGIPNIDKDKYSVSDSDC